MKDDKEPYEENIDEEDWTTEGEDDLATIEANLEALEAGRVADNPFINRKETK